MKSLRESILDQDFDTRANDKVEAVVKEFQNMTDLSEEVQEWFEKKYHCKFEIDNPNPKHEEYLYKSFRDHNEVRYVARIPNVSQEEFRKLRPKFKRLFDKISKNLNLHANGYTHRSHNNVVDLDYFNEVDNDIWTPCSVKNMILNQNYDWGLIITVIKFNQ